MTDNEDAAAGLLVHLFKDTDEILKAPEIDTGFRLIKDRKGGAACQHHGDLDAL